jgi:hypothetical protein
MIRDRVFISYSRVDKAWLQEIQVALKVLEHNHQMVIWDDTKIEAGKKWQTEIQQAIKECKVAVLLVSTSFLASTFIAKRELPEILNAAKKEGLVIFNLIIDINSYRITDLSEYQCLNDPGQPLKYCNERDKQEVYVKLTDTLLGLINQSRNDIAPLENIYFSAILILKYLVKNGEKSITEIQTGTMIRRKIVISTLEKLKKHDYINKVKLGKKEKPSTMWKASALGVTIYNQFESTYNLIADVPK